MGTLSLIDNDQHSFLIKLYCGELACRNTARSPERGRTADRTTNLTSIELCAGACGQAQGLERAGFAHEALVEIDSHCRSTLLLNRPDWNVLQEEQADLTNYNGAPYKGIDLLAAGLPCPPFSIASKQLGSTYETNLFPDALRVIDETRPRLAPS